MRLLQSKQKVPSILSRRKQGIAGLFDDCSEVYVYVGSGSEVSTNVASPAPLTDLDEESDPWESIARPIEDEIAQESNICASARLPPANSDEGYVPVMPCAAGIEDSPHRPKIVAFNSHSWITVNACVARPVGKKELSLSPGAQASMKAEWDRLRTKVVWDETNVREWSDVAKEAQDAGVEINFCYLFGICVEKNSELPLGHPKRKFKGRVVFQGNRVTNQNWEAAIFQDLGSCPATMGASKTADFYDLMPGHAVEIADAEQAYIQALLTGTPCWICLPPEARPKSMGGFRRPVVKFLWALYGHPDSGTLWEQHCDSHVKSVGFEPIGEEWPSYYFHHKLRLFLVIYVDDSKMAGPKGNLSNGWYLLQKGLVIETPVPIGVYLGCRHEEGTMKVGDIVARTMTYNMEDFLTSCVDRYLELAGDGVKLRIVTTPFLVEDQGTSPQGAPSHPDPYS